ncbi:MAG: ribosomal protein S18-alanine N-acetyltransferase, partial [Hydrogenovibrio crunogenus]|nr:ribosomal protein S18-alanine N-acetyltransferase [Hydrogenovibrio crunogenus]
RDRVLSVEQQAYDYPWSEQGFEKALDDGLAYLLCDVDHRPLGYACFLTVLDEAHLLNFCIASKYVRQGVGFAAMQALIEYFKSADYQIMLLEVRESNSAVHLYKKLGFKENGIRPNYYKAMVYEGGELVQGREDAVLMSLNLADQE